MTRSKRVCTAVAVCLVSALLASPAWAQGPAKPQDGSLWLIASGVWLPNNGVMPKAKAPPVEKTPGGKPVPMSFLLQYGLSSDLVWRGINWSEYSGEGVERCNQQAAAAAELSLKEFGALGAVVWFDWWSGTDAAMEKDRHCEPLANDFTFYWRYPIAQAWTTVELGWSCIRFPGIELGSTQEIYVNLMFDDSWLWGTERPVLNPYAFYALDYDLMDCGSWIEFGIAPVIALDEVDCTKDVPVVQNMWVSPSLSLGIDHRYYGGYTKNVLSSSSAPVGEEDFYDPCDYKPATDYQSPPDVGTGLDATSGSGVDKHTRCANIVYGLALGCDLNGALGLTREWGNLAAIGYVNYSQALHRSFINDEFWGGMVLAWSW